VPGPTDTTVALVRWVLGAVLLVTAAFVLPAPGEVAWSWDEEVDMTIVSCLADSPSPFDCRRDISQTRVPFYIHWVVEELGGGTGHYLLSAAFALLNVVLVFVVARARLGPTPALVAAALTGTAPAVLASARMLLSHSNVIFTTFSLLTLLFLDRFCRSGSVRALWLSAVGYGLALGSSMLAMFLAIPVAGLWLLCSRQRRLALAIPYGLIAVVVFFASTVIYLRPANLELLIEQTVRPHTVPWPDWNYLGLGTTVAPRWFSPLLFGIRVGPWWFVAFLVAPLVLHRCRHRLPPDATRFALVLWGSFALNMLLKSGVFQYDAPHQQAPWFPLVFIVIAGAVVAGLRQLENPMQVIAASAVVLAAGLQFVDAQRFWPNYLFYGSQYGQHFIGEFYGPASIHRQDRDDIDRELDRLIRERPDVKVLMADHNMFERHGAPFVAFTSRQPAERYEFALLDRLYGTHLEYPERDAYNEFLEAEGYEPYRTHHFPVGEWAYMILRRKGG
jgi:4-amino-4-deoxy-L-arabinose transferase-like glycosyltransferase